MNGTEIGERELASLCSKGDRAAMKMLYTKYAARVITLCSRYAHGPEEAKDYMHDTMLEAIVSIGRFQYRGEGSLYAWICRIAINTSLNKLRKKGQMVLSGYESEDASFDEPIEDEADAVPLKELERMVSELPETKKVIFNLYCIERCSHREIADRLGITEKASSSLLSKARKMLAEKIHEYINRMNENE